MNHRGTERTEMVRKKPALIPLRSYEPLLDAVGAFVLGSLSPLHSKNCDYLYKAGSACVIFVGFHPRFKASPPRLLCLRSVWPRA